MALTDEAGQFLADRGAVDPRDSVRAAAEELSGGYHRPTITVRVVEVAPDGDGWRQYRSGGVACAVCPCGKVTGWVPTAEAVADYRRCRETAAAGPDSR